MFIMAARETAFQALGLLHLMVSAVQKSDHERGWVVCCTKWPLERLHFRPYAFPNTRWVLSGTHIVRPCAS